MTNTPPPAPRLDDIRDVLRLVLAMLKDSPGVDIALELLHAGAGDRVDDFGITPRAARAAANRFVLDVLIEAVAGDVSPPDGP
jgi:hypothetical protein